MNSIEIFADTHALARAAVDTTIATLREAITEYGAATWVLTGGTTPALAYQLLAEQSLDQIDWSHVTIIMGDERIVPLDSPDSNWHMAEQVLLKRIPQATFLRPLSDQTAEIGAGEYATQLAALPQHKGLPRLDLVWLGMGEDGHTLSLFPHHPGLISTNQLVIPIHSSPKPPSDRFTLTFAALGGAQKTIILAAGESKAEAVKQALQPDSTLPIAQAARLTHAAWLIDEAAARLL